MAANTLTGLVPTIYEALDIVSRELVGLIPAVSKDANAQRVALNQVVRSPVTPALTSANITPANIAPDYGATVISSVDVSITKSKAVAFGFQGEEVLSLSNSPVVAPYGAMRRDLIAQAVRTLINEVEVDLAAVVRVFASRAYGTAGTTPFGTGADMSDIAQILKILQDNGCPITGPSDLRMVLNTTASANLRGKQSQLFKVNESGNDGMLRRGMIGDLMGFGLGETAALGSLITKGTGASYLTNSASLTVGTTVIPADTGSGTILAGDVVTFAGDTANKYMVVSALSGGSFTIAGPGLRVAIADNNAITVGNNFTPSVAFHRGAFQLVTRAPALPMEGDQAEDRVMVTDPMSGIALEFSMYKQYRQVRYEVALAWGVAGIASRHAAVLLG
jgi:hypothetical protein